MKLNDLRSIAECELDLHCPPKETKLKQPPLAKFESVSLNCGCDGYCGCDGGDDMCPGGDCPYGG